MGSFQSVQTNPLNQCRELINACCEIYSNMHDIATTRQNPYEERISSLLTTITSQLNNDRKIKKVRDTYIPALILNMGFYISFQNKFRSYPNRARIGRNADCRGYICDKLQQMIKLLNIAIEPKKKIEDKTQHTKIQEVKTTTEKICQKLVNMIDMQSQQMTVMNKQLQQLMINQSQLQQVQQQMNYQRPPFNPAIQTIAQTFPIESCIK